MGWHLHPRELRSCPPGGPVRGAAVVLRGDAAHLPLPDESVDLLCTSPPYYSQRSYVDAGKHYEGQIGSEGNAREYIDSLTRCTREWVRVLKPAGSLFVNLGDKYGRGTRTTIHGSGSKTGYVDGGGTGSCVPTGHDKSLLGLPWRYALACTDELDLVLRRDIIWSKCLSGGTQVYARVNGREKVVMVKDLARCVAGTAELWTGSKWSPMLRCEPTPPTEGRAASSLAARQARYRGRPIPPLAAALEIEFRNGERVGCTPKIGRA